MESDGLSYSDYYAFMSTQEEAFGSDYQSYLNQKHERFQTPRTAIDEMVRSATGSVPVKLERIVKGEQNEVYLIETEDLQHVVLKINRKGSGDFLREQWAVREVGKLGAPVSEILLIDSIEASSEALYFCVQKKLAGVPLNEIENPDPEMLKEPLKKAGSLLSKIHSVRTTGFGAINERGVGKFERANQYLLRSDDYNSAIFSAALKSELPEDYVKRGLEMIRRIAESYQYTDPRLLHWDYSLKHILVDDNKITGIIDWANAKSGDPIQEIARFDFYWHEYTDWLKQGYEQEEIFYGEFEKAFLMYRLHFGFNVLMYYVDEKNAYGISSSKDQIIQMLS